jgi:hypothetical protein
MQVNTEQARAAFEAAGLKGNALEQAVAGLANMRVTAEIVVRTNVGEERKFGDVSIVKIQANGFERPIGGFQYGQLPDLISQLQAALDSQQEDAS